jgi:hypothetical protein
MRQTLIILTIIISSCSTKQNKENDVLNIQAIADSNYILTTKNFCEQSKISEQFDLIIDFKRYSDSIAEQDSSFLVVYIKDKNSKTILDSIVCNPCPFFDYYFLNCDSMTSYSTGFNSKREIVDNYFGDIVVADLNFDGNDDLAIINDGGGNGGPAYFFYTQTNKKTFIQDNYLTDSVTYFPTKINKTKKQITTYVHAGACCVGEHIYNLNKTTNKWNQTSHKILGQ